MIRGESVEVEVDTVVSEPVRFGDPLHCAVMEFLEIEAELLDGGRFKEWLDLLTRDVSYRMPVRTDRGDGMGMPLTEEKARFSGSGFFDEDWASLDLRIRRSTDSRFNWAEQPQSRTRRFVTNVRAHRVPGSDLGATSNLLLVRSRWRDPGLDLISAQRNDRFRSTPEGGLLLASREVLVDQTNLAATDLAIFL